MEIYVLKSAGCLAIFLTFYKVFMEKESFHVFKRAYLLVGLSASFLIPLVTFTNYVEVASITQPGAFLEGGVVVPSEIGATINYFPFILWTMYFMGVLFFSLKFIKNLFSLVYKIRKNPCLKRENIFHVLLKVPTTPHTFFSYIFLNKEKFQKKEIPHEVLVHEKAHALQKHSLDILFIELLQLVFWFNPVLYFFKNSIKLNHEFLADQAVLTQGNERISYQKILLAFSSNASSPAMANSIHYSSFKKRFTVMKTQTSRRVVWLKTLLLLPLVALLLYGFSTTETVETPLETSENTGLQDAYKNWHENVINNFQNKATKEELAEYNKLAKEYNSVDIKQRIIKLKDLNRLEYIYNKMTPNQKKEAQPFPECFPPPPPPPPTKANEMMPPPPPPPPVPLDHVIEMAKDGAEFYYEGKKISSDSAIDIVQKNQNIYISTHTKKGIHIINLSTKPIVTKQ
jgi:hypothetical protein